MSSPVFSWKIAVHWEFLGHTCTLLAVQSQRCKRLVFKMSRSTEQCRLNKCHYWAVMNALWRFNGSIDPVASASRNSNAIHSISDIWTRHESVPPNILYRCLNTSHLSWHLWISMSPTYRLYWNLHPPVKQFITDIKTNLHRTSNICL